MRLPVEASLIAVLWPERHFSINRTHWFWVQWDPTAGVVLSKSSMRGKQPRLRIRACWWTPTWVMDINHIISMSIQVFMSWLEILIFCLVALSYITVSGYSTAVGEKKNTLLYFAGAPRFNHMGQVVLFSRFGKDWRVVERVNGSQVSNCLEKVLSFYFISAF